MIPSCNEIIDGRLYLGNSLANFDVEYRTTLGFTHIVSVCQNCPSTGPNHLSIPIDDSEYEDLLIHLPKAIKFIEQALDESGKVLVHCVMGVSRSAAVVAAYLMKTKRIGMTEAVEYIRQRRPVVLPNYGFCKQLEVFAKCGYELKPHDSVYQSWKRRTFQEVTSYLTHIDDIATIIPDRLSMTTEFPQDDQQGRHLLQEFEITHLVTIGSCCVPGAASALGLQVHEMRVTEQTQNLENDVWLRELPSICKVIGKAIQGGGRVLIYAKNEIRAAVVVCGYLMASKKMSHQSALSMVEGCLPLFTPTDTFLRQLSLLDTDPKLVDELASLDSDDSDSDDSDSARNADVAELTDLVERGCQIHVEEQDKCSKPQDMCSVLPLVAIQEMAKERPHTFQAARPILFN